MNISVFKESEIVQAITCSNDIEILLASNEQTQDKHKISDKCAAPPPHFYMNLVKKYSQIEALQFNDWSS